MPAAQTMSPSPIPSFPPVNRLSPIRNSPGSMQHRITGTGIFSRRCSHKSHAIPAAAVGTGKISIHRMSWNPLTVSIPKTAHSSGFIFLPPVPVVGSGCSSLIPPAKRVPLILPGASIRCIPVSYGSILPGQ